VRRRIGIGAVAIVVFVGGSFLAGRGMDANASPATGAPERGVLPMTGGLMLRASRLDMEVGGRITRVLMTSISANST
jgi:hypothetical protein